MTYATVQSCTLEGVTALPVTVEVHIAGGLPTINIVGLPQSAVRESKDRVRAAILNAGFDFPLVRVTVNLAPADLPKQGGRFDLPIALGIMLAKGYLPKYCLDNFCVVGELGLNGELRAVKGVLPAALALQNTPIRLLCPVSNFAEAARCQAASLVCASTLKDVVLGLRQSTDGVSEDFTEQVLAPRARYWSSIKKDDSTQRNQSYPLLNKQQNLLGATVQAAATAAHQASDLADVKGHALARRALEIAAAGAHNLLLLGSPGTGKSLLAGALASILPPMSEQEALETAAIVSVSQGGFDASQYACRPFRSPHHTAPTAALIGGGARPMPGEISLAHNGVLFLDEMAEFPRRVLDALREPLEAGVVQLSRARIKTSYPARFQLVAATNLCPCGYYGDVAKPCKCSNSQVFQYRSRLSGPLLDRIDLKLHLERVESEKFLKKDRCESSASVLARVQHCRTLQLHRQGYVNRWIPAAELLPMCDLQAGAAEVLHNAAEQFQLSQRALHSALRTARTIADLADAKRVGPHHVVEALSYRSDALNGVNRFESR